MHTLIKHTQTLRLVEPSSHENCACNQRTELLASTWRARGGSAKCPQRPSESFAKRRPARHDKRDASLRVRGRGSEPRALLITAKELRIRARGRRARNRLIVLRPGAQNRCFHCRFGKASVDFALQSVEESSDDNVDCCYRCG